MTAGLAAWMVRAGCQFSAGRSVLAVVSFALAGASLVWAAPASTLFKSEPLVVSVADVPESIDEGAVSDLKLADFDGDGRVDIAALWFFTSYEDMSLNQRYLTVFLNRGDATFERAYEYDLYIPDYDWPTYSVFLDGTAALGLGDFDGDGDADLVASAFFGDELYFFENLGGGAFAPHLRHRYYNQSGPWLVTIPEIHAADFDGDGADEVVYISDPSHHPDGWPIHFWTTDDTIENMTRVMWFDRYGDLAAVYWRRALAVGQFDDDGIPDLCFTGSESPSEINSALQFWSDLNVSSRGFWVSNASPSFIASDVVALRVTEDANPGLVLTNADGTRMQYWERADGAFAFTVQNEVTGYAGLAPDRGMAAAVGDVDGDGDQDLVTRQLVSLAGNPQQIEITLSSADGGVWERVVPTPISTAGLMAAPDSPLFRPRALALGDLCGNTLPEIVAGFGYQRQAYQAGAPSSGELELAIWWNSCVGDANRDRKTDGADLCLIQSLIGKTAGMPGFDPDADLDKDGEITYDDVVIVLDDFACRCTDCGWGGPADMNCDGSISGSDIDAFVIALTGEENYEQCYPDCDWMNGDLNGDGTVNWRDINMFVFLLQAQHGESRLSVEFLRGRF